MLEYETGRPANGKAATRRFAATHAYSTAFERFVGALESHGHRVVIKGDYADATCPAHGSTSLKLRIFRRDDSIGLNCISMSCPAADVVAAVGLELRDLFDGEKPPGYVPPVRRTPSPWDIITDGPGIEHVCRRMVVQARLAHGIAPVPNEPGPPGPGVPDRRAMSYMDRERATEYAKWVLRGGRDD